MGITWPKDCCFFDKTHEFSDIAAELHEEALRKKCLKYWSVYHIEGLDKELPGTVWYGTMCTGPCITHKNPPREHIEICKYWLLILPILHISHIRISLPFFSKEPENALKFPRGFQVSSRPLTQLYSFSSGFLAIWSYLEQPSIEN